MPAALPPSKPQASRDRIVRAIIQAGKSFDNEVILVGVRGYYRDSMGEKGKNDRAIYDDAAFIISPLHFSSWNFNTDPSVFKKGIATLVLGAHRYKMGNHGISRPGGGYPAFRPATPSEELPVSRDGVAVPWNGVAINIHRGGNATTSSEGCQTVPPSQWDSFYASLSGQLKKLQQKEFTYLLLDVSQLPPEIAVEPQAPKSRTIIEELELIVAEMNLPEAYGRSSNYYKAHLEGIIKKFKG